MDDDTKQLAKIGAEVALRPATELIDNVLGVFGGDALAEFRERQRMRRRERHARLSEEAVKVLQDRGVKEPVEPNAEVIDELAEAAQCEPREELRQLWAKLLAAAFDPSLAPFFRRQFVEIARQLEPLDARILPELNVPGAIAPSRKEALAKRLQASADEVEVAFLNLHRLELIWPNPREITSPQGQPWVLPLGRRFLAAVS